MIFWLVFCIGMLFLIRYKLGQLDDNNYMGLISAPQRRALIGKSNDDLMSDIENLQVELRQLYKSR